MRGCVRYVTRRCWRYKSRLCRVDVCMCGNCDGNMGFMFVACINVRNVNVSSSLQIWWDKIFFCLPSGAEASVDLKVTCVHVCHDSRAPSVSSADGFYFYFSISTTGGTQVDGGAPCGRTGCHSISCLKALLVTTQTSSSWIKKETKESALNWEHNFKSQSSLEQLCSETRRRRSRCVDGWKCSERSKTRQAKSVYCGHSMREPHTLSFTCHQNESNNVLFSSQISLEMYFLMLLLFFMTGFFSLSLQPQLVWIDSVSLSCPVIFWSILSKPWTIRIKSIIVHICSHLYLQLVCD